MIEKIGYIFSIVTIVLSGYGLLSRNFKLMPFMMLSLGGTVLVSGIEKLKRESRSISGYMRIVASLFLLFASIKGFILNFF